MSVSSNTTYFVQKKFIQKEFSKKFNVNIEDVYVEFPDIEKIDANKISSLNKNEGETWFVYPATPLLYKKHITLVEALHILKQKNPELAETIKVHLTLKKGIMPDLEREIQRYNLSENFIFHGVIPHDDLLRIYKSSDGLLFPSVIETLGLPLLEAASFGLPIVVSKLGYSEAVIGNYKGTYFVESGNIDQWYNAIINIVQNKKKYEHLVQNDYSSWNELFSIIYR